MQNKHLSIQRTIHVLAEPLTYNEWMEYIIRERQKIERAGLIEIEKQVEKVLHDQDQDIVPQSHINEVINLFRA